MSTKSVPNWSQSGALYNESFLVQRQGDLASSTPTAAGSFLRSDGTSLIDSASAVNIGTTSTAGAVLENTTAAAAGAQQYSPRLEQACNGWKTTSTAASVNVRYGSEVRPVQGTTAPTHSLVFMSKTGTGAWTDAVAIKPCGLSLLAPFTVATKPAAVEGDIGYCTNGDTGSKCLAFFDGTNWLRISLGAAIAAA